MTIVQLDKARWRRSEPNPLDSYLRRLAAEAKSPRVRAWAADFLGPLATSGSLAHEVEVTHGRVDAGERSLADCEDSPEHPSALVGDRALPRPIRVGRSNRWDRAAVRDFLEAAAEKPAKVEA